MQSSTRSVTVKAGQMMDKKRSWGAVTECEVGMQQLEDGDFISSIIQSSLLPSVPVSIHKQRPPRRCHKAIKLTMQSAAVAEWNVSVRNVSIRIISNPQSRCLRLSVGDPSAISAVSACPTGESASKRRKTSKAVTTVEMSIPSGDIDDVVFQCAREERRSCRFRVAMEPDNLIGFLRAGRASDASIDLLDDAFAKPVTMRLDLHHDDLLALMLDWTTAQLSTNQAAAGSEFPLEVEFKSCGSSPMPSMVGVRAPDVDLTPSGGDAMAVEAPEPSEQDPSVDLPLVDRASQLRRPASAGSRYALVVGVSNFCCPKIANLRFAASDAVKVAERLGELGYDVTSMHDESEDFLRPTYPNFMVELKRLCSLVKPEDTLLVYMATHGIRLQGVGPTLLFADTRFENLADASWTMPLSRLETMLDKHTPASRRLLFLDCCHQGLETGRGVGQDAAESVFGDGAVKPPACDPWEVQSHFELAEGLGCLYASSAHQLAAEAQDSGLFTRFLLEGLQPAAAKPDDAVVCGKADVAGKGFVSFHDLVRFVTPQLKRFCLEKRLRPQDPTWRFSGAGDVIVADYRPCEPM